VHNGTHADAPFHFEKNGTTIDRLPLETFIGRALVIDLAPIFSTEAKRREISIADLEPFATELNDASRLLLKTSDGRDTAIFPTCIPVLAPDVPVWLKASGVILIGVDLPSVDTIDSTFPIVTLWSERASRLSKISTSPGSKPADITSRRYR
jgi:arylformamidase